MREIEFRGKCLDSGTWVYGSLFNNIWRKSADGSRVCYIFADDMLDDDNGCGDSWEDFASVADQYEVDPATVGQYTGMKDKNGKKVFEGDVMRFTTEFGETVTSEVAFMDGYFYVQGEADDDIYGIIYAVEAMNAEVLGNIHDKPCLLK